MKVTQSVWAEGVRGIQRGATHMLTMTAEDLAEARLLARLCEAIYALGIDDTLAFLEPLAKNYVNPEYPEDSEA